MIKIYHGYVFIIVIDIGVEKAKFERLEEMAERLKVRLQEPIICRCSLTIEGEDFKNALVVEVCMCDSDFKFTTNELRDLTCEMYDIFRTPVLGQCFINGNIESTYEYRS